MIMHGSLQKFIPESPGIRFPAQRPANISCTAADHDRIDKYTQRLDKSGFYRNCHFLLPPHTEQNRIQLRWKTDLFYSVHNHDTRSRRQQPDGIRKLPEISVKYSRDTSHIFKYNKQRDRKIKHCHHRHHKIQHFNRRILTQHNNSCGSLPGRW